MAILVSQVVSYILHSKLLFFFFPSKHLDRVILLTDVSTTEIQVQIQGDSKEDTHHPGKEHKKYTDLCWLAALNLWWVNGFKQYTKIRVLNLQIYPETQTLRRLDCQGRPRV